MNVARASLGRVSAMGLLALSLLFAPSVIGAAVSAGAVGIYGQHSGQAADCWTVDWTQPTPGTACRAWSAPLQTGLPVDTWIQQDFCMNYGPGAREMNQPASSDLSAFFGFRQTSGQYQKIDPVTQSACAITGSSSKWGMVLRGSSANGFCVPSNCGMMHLLNWTTNAIRPFQGGRSLLYGAQFGVANDNVGPFIPQSVWHGYLCPALTDTSSSQGILLCQELWRSDPGADAICHEQISVFGFGVCTVDGKVTAVMAPGGQSGFREFIGPDPGGNYGMVWTRPQAGTILSTSTGEGFRASNQLGTHRYASSVSPAQLRQIVAMFNLALSIDQRNGFYQDVSPMSTNLSNWAMTSLQVGVEGNSVNGSSTAMIGFNTQGLFARSH
jgi:hypothetical protein